MNSNVRLLYVNVEINVGLNFPDIDVANEPIIAVYTENMITGEVRIFSRLDYIDSVADGYNKTACDVHSIFTNEVKLLTQMLDYVSTPNTELVMYNKVFDHVYVKNRLLRLQSTGDYKKHSGWINWVNMPVRDILSIRKLYNDALEVLGIDYGVSSPVLKMKRTEDLSLRALLKQHNMDITKSSPLVVSQLACKIIKDFKWYTADIEGY